MIHHLRPKIAGLLSLFVLTGGCTLGYDKDKRFQAWLLETQTRCFERYGPLPTMPEEERKTYLQITYDTYYGITSRELLANKLAVRYPNHKLVINCMANSFPRRY